MKRYYIQYRGRNLMVKDTWIDAESEQDALQLLRQLDKVIEVICCKEHFIGL